MLLPATHIEVMSLEDSVGLHAPVLVAGADHCKSELPHTSGWRYRRWTVTRDLCPKDGYMLGGM